MTTTTATSGDGAGSRGEAERRRRHEDELAVAARCRAAAALATAGQREAVGEAATGAERLDGVDGGWRSPATATATGQRRSAGAVVALYRSGGGRFGTDEDRPLLRSG
ncbi:hypothetical protein E2562_030644 [Oryza meyeriana var. granulata]|uniref:Uncharacterized protein n=1 Tax=Oryza meyeriana var. granulata TaxID=110450 RepID=A0A6G1D9G7_9ORYZ|nr:hypothetical protein E2562_030644 [Oryza meyeriana var. granulata]